MDPTYAQMLLQLPPEASVQNAVFVHDYFWTFTTTLLLGIEVGRALV